MKLKNFREYKDNVNFKFDNQFIYTYNKTSEIILEQLNVNL